MVPHKILVKNSVGPSKKPELSDFETRLSAMDAWHASWHQVLAAFDLV